MSDLVSGNGRVSNGSARVAAGPVPVSQAPPAAFRPPTEVMRDRRNRERAKREAEEAEQRRLQGENQAQNVASRTQGQDVGGPRSYAIPTSNQPDYDSQSVPDVRQPDPSRYPRIQTQPTSGPSLDPSNYGQQRPADQATSRVRPSQAPEPPRAAPYQSSSTTRPQAQPQPRPNTGAGQSTQNPGDQYGDPSQQRQQQQQQQQQGGGIPQDSSQRRSNTSSFPHAFERWEDLSSRWEGLTSHLIRRMEVNAEEIKRDPLSQQMSRQITDLSAAGANLFHAVVELQRLRASSERKFQRWFFETRAEQERAQEVQAELENQIRIEQAQRSQREAQPDMSSLVARAEQETANAHQMMAEMRRELQISKEEARRAWEELGRRAQEERDRTASLRDGQPTLVGGVHVVPMQSMMSRGPSVQRSTRDETYRPGQPVTPGQPADNTYASYGPQEHSPTDTDPFTEGGRSLPPQIRPLNPAAYGPYAPGATPATSSSTAQTAIPLAATAATAGTAASQFYRHQDSTLHGNPAMTGNQWQPPRGTSERSYVPSVEDPMSEEAESEYEIDANGNYRLDAQGNRIPYGRGARTYLSEGGEESIDEQEERERELRLAERYGTTSTASNTGPAPRVLGPSHRQYLGYSGTMEGGTGPVDYEGLGYGENIGRTGLQHQHLSRLSDVVEEEEERARTSPTRASQASRGY